MKFKKGDIIQVKESGHRGTIMGVSFNSINQVQEYYIVWDNFKNFGHMCYIADSADDIWDKVAQIKDAMEAGITFGDPSQGYIDQDGNTDLPMGMYGVQPGDSAKKPCEHRWVEVGFMHTKTICYHCDMEKK